MSLQSIADSCWDAVCPDPKNKRQCLDENKESICRCCSERGISSCCVTLPGYGLYPMCGTDCSEGTDQYSLSLPENLKTRNWLIVLVTGVVLLGVGYYGIKYMRYRRRRRHPEQDWSV